MHGGGPGFESPRLHPGGRRSGVEVMRQHACRGHEDRGEVGRIRARSEDGFARGLPTSGGGDLSTGSLIRASRTLTTRHAEPEGFCGRGNQRGPWRTWHDRESPAPPAAVAAGSWRVARAHCINTSRNTTRCPAGEERAWSGAEPGGRSLWREPVCGRRHDVCGMDTNAGIRMMGAWWMPWRWRPRKDAATRRNAPGRRWQPAIRGCPNGATRPAHGRALWERSRRGHRGN